jgi:glycosyltransferase involved in cell wall biosynthesis
MNTQYKVSVVTPFHNVDMAMFEKCAASMRAQTIGFENVQWIIVIHNCDESYKQALPEMFKNDPNVVLQVLDNEARTPSSPRNHGTQFATAPYVGYLDGDDSYLPNCLEVAVQEAEETKSQMVWFRREVVKESPKLQMLAMTAPWDNTRRRIVVEHQDWGDQEVFEDFAYAFVTSYLFERSFLERIGLKFNEEVIICEDMLYVLEGMVAADRICYLPQHIGYLYYVNSGSLVQKYEKPAEELIKIAEGFRYIFDVMQSYGIDTQLHVQCMAAKLAQNILASAITLEQRQTIKNILGPYVMQSHLLPVSKTFSSQERQLSLAITRDVILNPENPGAQFLQFLTDNVAELITILRHNAETDMGRRYHFEKLDTAIAYRNRLPLADKDYYRPLIDLQTRVGERNIITADPIVRYLSSSDGELTPFTEKQSRRYAECLGETLKGKHNLLFVRSHPVTAHTNDGAVVDTLNSAIVKDYFAHCHFRDGVPQAWLASPVERFYASSQSEDDFYDLMVDALMASDADQLVAFTAKDLLSAMQMLELDWRKLVELMPAGERRDEVQRILSEGFDSPVVPRLWPKVRRVVCYGAGKMRESMQQLRRYIGSLPHNHGYDYLKSAVMGKAVADNSDLFECIKEHCFYEFLPCENAADESKTLLWSELVFGKSYRVVVTNHAGLYRYRTGHIIVPQEVTPESIKFTIS